MCEFDKEHQSGGFHQPFQTSRTTQFCAKVCPVSGIRQRGRESPQQTIPATPRHHCPDCHRRVGEITSWYPTKKHGKGRQGLDGTRPIVASLNNDTLSAQDMGRRDSFLSPTTISFPFNLRNTVGAKLRLASPGGICRRSTVAGFRMCRLLGGASTIILGARQKFKLRVASFVVGMFLLAPVRPLMSCKTLMLGVAAFFRPEGGGRGPTEPWTFSYSSRSFKMAGSFSGL